MVGVARSVAIEKCNLLQYVPKSDSDRCLKCNMNTPLSSWVDRIGVWVHLPSADIQSVRGCIVPTRVLWVGG